MVMVMLMVMVAIMMVILLPLLLLPLGKLELANELRALTHSELDMRAVPYPIFLLSSVF